MKTCMVIYLVLQIRHRQLLPQLASRFFTQRSAVNISHRAIAVVDLSLDLFEVSTNALRPPLVTVANAAAALYKPVASGSPHSIESGKGSCEMLARTYPSVSQQLGQYSTVFDTQTCSCAVMRRCSVTCIANDTDSVLGVSRNRIDPEVEYGPLMSESAYISSLWAEGHAYDVKILTGQTQQTAQRFAEVTEVVQKLFFCGFSCQALRIWPVLRGGLECHNVESISPIDRERQDVCVLAHLLLSEIVAARTSSKIHLRARMHSVPALHQEHRQRLALRPDRGKRTCRYTMAWRSEILGQTWFGGLAT
jgi:hypothetical protein